MEDVATTDREPCNHGDDRLGECPDHFLDVEDVQPRHTVVADVPSLVTIVPATDGMSAQITFLGVGVVNLSVQATSLGNAISGDNTVQVTIQTPPPPAATVLHVAFSIP